MLFQDAADDYLKWLRHEKRYSDGTYHTYKWWLNHYARWVLSRGADAPLSVSDAFSGPTLREYQHSLSERKLANRTILAAFYGLRGLGDFLIAQKILSANPVRDLTMPQKGAAERRIVGDGEIEKMLAATGLQRDKADIAYERALLSTLVLTGVRAAEMLDMRIPHLHWDTRTLIVPHGKGDKARTLYPPDEFWTAMRDWIAIRPVCDHDWVWPCDRARRISVETMRAQVEEIKARAGLSHATWIKPHSLRHAFATRMMVNGAPIRVIQASLGHSDAQTTLNYLHHAEEAAKDMRSYASLVPPAPTQPEPRIPRTPASDRASDLRARRNRQSSK